MADARVGEAGGDTSATCLVTDRGEKCYLCICVVYACLSVWDKVAISDANIGLHGGNPCTLLALNVEVNTSTRNIR